MTEVLNLQTLRGISGTPGEIVYVKGHTTAGDGGGGIFLWRTEAGFISGIYSSDNNGTIIKPTSTNAGRWVRQYENFISVTFFGAFGQSGDYTIAIQKAIDFAKINTTNTLLKGSTVFFPNGSYVASKITLRSGVSLLGESLDFTTVYSTSGNAGEYLVEIEEGPVFTNLSNLRFIGNNTNKGCFLLEAKLDTSLTHGGLWFSRFSNIQIRLFNGDGIYLKGGTNQKLPNQFNIFENVRVLKTSDFSHALKMTGQNGQHTFTNCEFDGFFRNNTYSRGHNVFLASTGIQLAVISFINCTIQDADYGVMIEQAENITFDNCWFENLGVALTILPKNGNQSKSINILNSRFANASGFGSLNAPNNIKNGQCIQVTNSYVNIQNNYVLVSNPDNVNSGAMFVLALDNHSGGVTLTNNKFLHSRLSKTTNTFTFSAGIIRCAGNKLIYVSGGLVTSIESSLDSGEYLTIIGAAPITFFSGPSLSLAGRDSFLIASGDAATFIKLDVLNDNTERFALVSYAT